MQGETYLISVDIGVRNFAIGFATVSISHPTGTKKTRRTKEAEGSQVAEGSQPPPPPIHVHQIAKIDLKQSRAAATQEQISVFLMKSLHSILDAQVTDLNTPLLLVIEKQVPKAKRNMALAMLTLSTVCTWSHVRGRREDMYQFMTALNKFHPTHVPLDLKEFKTHSKRTISTVLLDEIAAPTFICDQTDEDGNVVNLHEMIFVDNKDKADDLCDCLLQLRSITTQLRKGSSLDPIRSMEEPFAAPRQKRQAPSEPSRASQKRAAGITKQPRAKRAKPVKPSRIPKQLPASAYEQVDTYEAETKGTFETEESEGEVEWDGVETV